MQLLLIYNYNIFSECSSAADIAIIIDASSSVGESNFRTITDFVKNLISSYDTNVQFALVKFSNSATVQFNFDSNLSRDQMLQSVDSIFYDRSGSNIAQGLQTTREQVFTRDRGDVPNVAILIVASSANIRAFDVENEGNVLKNEGVKLVAIGIGNDVNFGQLERVVSISNQAVRLSRFSDLSASLGQVVGYACPSITQSGKDI